MMKLFHHTALSFLLVTLLPWCAVGIPTELPEVQDQCARAPEVGDPNAEKDGLLLLSLSSKLVRKMSVTEDPVCTKAKSTLVRHPASKLLQEKEAGAGAGDPKDPKDYEAAYNKLYDSHGYHNDPELSHEGPVVELAKLFAPQALAGAAKTPAATTSITLGCSHGKGVASLHAAGFDASGVDVAQKAIAMAEKLRGATCTAKPCFKTASLEKIPWKNQAFAVGLSSDVLEHIAPEDVPQVAKEISRVVKTTLFLRIANFVELSKTGEKAGMTGNVHLTVQGAGWWVQQFAPFGWKVRCDLSDPNGEKHQAGNYVLMVLERHV